MYTEASYEKSLIELFQGMGYSYVYGPSVDRDYRSPLYEAELESALSRLNPSVPANGIADALYKLHNFENGSLVQKNAVFMDYLQNGITVSYLVKGETGQDPSCIWWTIRTRTTTLSSSPTSGPLWRTATIAARM